MPILWESVPPVSEEAPLSGAAACEFAGSVYIFGGFDSDTGAPGSEMRHCVFDVAQRSWLGPQSLDIDGDVPTPRAGATATRVRSTIYLFGGQQVWPSTQLDDLYAGSVVREGVVEWLCLTQPTELVPAPEFTSAQRAAAAEAGARAASKVMQQGGGGDDDQASLGTSSPAVQAAYAKAEHDALYGKDPNSALARRFSPLHRQPPPSPPHRAWHAACAMLGASGEQVVVVCGGFGRGAAQDARQLWADTWTFDPEARVWLDVTDFAAPPKAKAKDGPGKKLSKRASQQEQAAAAAGAEPPSPTGSEGSLLSEGGGSVASFGSFASLGGGGGGGGSGGLPSPLPRAHHTLTAVGGGRSAVLFGGQTPSEDRTSDVWVLEGRMWTWSQVAKGPPPPVIALAAKPGLGGKGQIAALKACAVDGSDAEEAGDNGEKEGASPRAERSTEEGEEGGEEMANGSDDQAESPRGDAVAGGGGGGAKSGGSGSMADDSLAARDYFPGPPATTWHGSCAALVAQEVLDLAYSDAELDALAALGGDRGPSSGSSAASLSPTVERKKPTAAASQLAQEDGAGSLAGSLRSKESGRSGKGKGKDGPRAFELWQCDPRDDPNGDRAEVVLIFGGISAAPGASGGDGDGGARGGGSVASGGSASSAGHSHLPGYAAPLFALDRRGRWHLLDTADGQPPPRHGGPGGAEAPAHHFKGPVHPGLGPRFGLVLVTTGEDRAGCLAVGGTGTGALPAYAAPPSDLAGGSSTFKSGGFAAGCFKDSSVGSGGGGRAGAQGGNDRVLRSGGLAAGGGKNEGGSAAGGFGGGRARGRHGDACMLNLFGAPIDYAALGLQAKANVDRRKKADKKPKGPVVVTVQLPHGGVFEGYLDAKGLRTGRGRLVDGATGDTYVGDFCLDAKEGQGTMTYGPGSASAGCVYKGSWAADLPEGQGTMTYPVAASGAGNPRAVVAHAGSWRGGLKHGAGEAVHGDGAVLGGVWRGGRLKLDSAGNQPGATLTTFASAGGGSAGSGGGDGGKQAVAATVKNLTLDPATEKVLFGTEVLAPATGGGQEVYTGSFNASGQRHGDDGHCAFADGSTYRGSWRCGRRNGKGTFTDGVTKEVYEGKWVGGERCGRGLCTYAAGHRYDGQWGGGQRDGEGIFFRASGETYTGNWRAGERHGRGVATDARGRVVKGTWKLGKLMEDDGAAGAKGGSSAGAQGGGSAARPEDDDEFGDGDEGEDERTVESLVSLDGPSVASAVSVDFNADSAFA